MAVVDAPTEVPERPEPELLLPEAGRRRRRHWLLAIVILLVVSTVAVVGIAVVIGSPAPNTVRVRPHRATPPQSIGLPTGGYRSLEQAGPLAVSPSGSLFIVDPARHQILVRLDNGRFRLVAGNGTAGFSGDGGPATAAALTGVTDMAFAPNGDLYLADGNRVRMVDTRGIIETVAGDGDSGGLVTGGTTALTAALGPISSVAISPTGTVYLATSPQILRLDPNGQLQPVTALVQPGDNIYRSTGLTPLTSLGQIAVDAEGVIYASSIALGWSVYRITPDGTATYLGAARRSGGNTAIVQLGPDGVAYAGNGPFIIRVNGDRLTRAFSLSSVPGIPESYFLDFFTFASNGTVYADNLGSSAFNRRQELVSLAHGHTTLLWRHLNH